MNILNWLKETRTIYIIIRPTLLHNTLSECWSYKHVHIIIGLQNIIRTTKLRGAHFLYTLMFFIVKEFCICETASIAIREILKNCATFLYIKCYYSCTSTVRLYVYAIDHDYKNKTFNDIINNAFTQ